MVRGHFLLYVVRNQVVLDFFHQKIVQRKKSELGLYEFNACISINKFRLEKAG